MRQFTLLVILLITGLFQVASAQNRSISGRVLDRSNNQGLPGVTVLVKGTTLGTATNNDGSFVLSAPATATTLTFSFIGYTSIDQPIGDGTNISVSLATDAKQIGEVVVTGALGIQRQAQEIGYATATLNTQELTQARVTNVTNGLAGKVSGLQIQTIGSGISPSVRVTLRGTRSLTGNNEALVVVDGVISTNDVLAALNPDDIADISVLKGANAAALYGSQASNGALIITTKKGGNKPQVTLSQTSQFESISFLPKFQTEFGPGANSWNQTRPVFAPNGAIDSNENYQYNSFENQQFGPRYDGSLQPVGERLENGNVQRLTYEARPNEKRAFWNNAYQAQNGITFSGGDEKTKFYASYQNVHNNGVVPKDKFDRNTFRFNASRELDRLTVGFNVSYSQQKVDATSNTTRDQSVYWNWFNASSLVPLTSYQNWQTDDFANPNGYYNAFYYNPYWVIDNNRTTDRRNTLLGNIDLSYKVRDWLRVQYRLGTTNTDQASIGTQDRFLYSAFTLANTNHSSSAQTPGFVQDISSNQNRINSDLFISMDKTFSDFNVKAILGNNIQQFTSRYNYVASTALATAGLFNLSNRVGQLSGFDARATTRLAAFYADLTLGYKDYLFVHGSGRNDNISTLDAGNRSYFYPSVDASLVFSNLVPALKDASFLDYGKLRGGVAKVSQVNLGGAGTTPFNSATGVYQTNGAYSLASTYGLGAGFPFGSLASFTANNGLVQPGLLPENTLSVEAGIEFSFLKRRVAGAVTYYAQKSTNQTVNTSVSTASGYSGLLLNAGEVQNQGIEADLNIVPIRLDNGLTVTLGANFNYNNNKVVSLPNDLPQLTLSTTGTANAGLYALKDQPYPILRGSYYQRTDDGRIKMAATRNAYDPNDQTTYYYPLKATDLKTFGNTQPKYKYGFNAAVAYKGLVLSGQGELRTGYVIYNAIGEDLDFTGSGTRSTMYGRQNFIYPNSAISTDGGATYVANTTGATPGGAEFWAQNSTWNRTVAENYVTSGTFFKIRELSLSYAFPAAMLTKAGFVKGLSLNVFGRNILTWVPKENIYTDPEFSAVNSGAASIANNAATINSNAVGINSNLQTPPTKFYGASLNVTL